MQVCGAAPEMIHIQAAAAIELHTGRTKNGGAFLALRRPHWGKRPPLRWIWPIHCWASACTLPPIQRPQIASKRRQWSWLITCNKCAYCFLIGGGGETNFHAHSQVRAENASPALVLLNAFAWRVHWTLRVAAKYVLRFQMFQFALVSTQNCQFDARK